MDENVTPINENNVDYKVQPNRPNEKIPVLQIALYVIFSIVILACFILIFNLNLRIDNLQIQNAELQATVEAFKMLLTPTPSP